MAIRITDDMTVLEIDNWAVAIGRLSEHAVADKNGVHPAGSPRGLAPMILRRHFIRRWGITPQAHRDRFSQLAGWRPARSEHVPLCYLM
jgi:hypothetical protein